MDRQYSNDFIYGNFVDDRQNFPIDVETLAAMQNNALLLAVLGRVVGVKRAILTGCAGTVRTPGYVWMETVNAPLAGEVLYYPGGGTSAQTKCHIEETDDPDLEVNGARYPRPYTRRRLVDGVDPDGGASYEWSGFEVIAQSLNSGLSLARLSRLLDNSHSTCMNAIDAIATSAQHTFVRGMIMLWSGTIATIPGGWALCDGSNGTPNLRDRFVVGATADDVDAIDVNWPKKPGNTGGVWRTKTNVTLNYRDIPAHRHVYVSDSDSGNGGAQAVDGSGDNWAASGSGWGAKFLTEGRVYASSSTYSHNDSTTTVTTSAFSIAPPYYALAYIMKL